MSMDDLLEDGALEVVPRPEHPYASLSLSPGSSVNRLEPYNAQSIDSYLHAQQSQHSAVSGYINRHPHSHGWKGHRRVSRSSQGSSRQNERIRHRFKKLQICVVSMCIVNFVVFAIVFLTNPKVSPFFSKEDDDFFTSGDGEPKSFKLCTKCQPLRAKIGFADELLRDIRSVQYPEFCCFRRVDQLLALFDGYAEEYTNQEVHKVRQEIGRNISDARTTNNPGPLPLAHLYYSDTGKRSDTLQPLTWQISGIDILLQGGVSVLRGNQHLRIPRTGYYYVYSNLQIVGGTTSHIVMKNYNTGRNEKKLLVRNIKTNKTVVSLLQSVFRLNRGDTLTVLASHSALHTGERGNYFGVFILQK